MKRTKAGLSGELMSAFNISQTHRRLAGEMIRQTRKQQRLECLMVSSGRTDYCSGTNVGCYWRCVFVSVCFAKRTRSPRRLCASCGVGGSAVCGLQEKTPKNLCISIFSLVTNQLRHSRKRGKNHNNFSPFASFSFAYLSFNRQHFLCLRGFLQPQ